MIYIRKTDRHIGRNIFIAAGALITQRKRNKTLAIATLVNRSLDLFRQHLDFPHDIVIRIASLKKKAHGRYNQNGSLEININQPRAQILITLAHELVHAEQYKQGRLVQKFKDHEGWVHSWHGTQVPNKGTTYEAYRRLPWEVEAFKRQRPLALKVAKEMERIYG